MNTDTTRPNKRKGQATQKIEPQRHIDYELYPPAATSHRLGWMITVHGKVQDGIYPCRDQAERAAKLEAMAAKSDNP